MSNILIKVGIAFDQDVMAVMGVVPRAAKKAVDATIVEEKRLAAERQKLLHQANQHASKSDAERQAAKDKAAKEAAAKEKAAVAERQKLQDQANKHASKSDAERQAARDKAAKEQAAKQKAADAKELTEAKAKLTKYETMQNARFRALDADLAREEKAKEKAARQDRARADRADRHAVTDARADARRASAADARSAGAMERRSTQFRSQLGRGVMRGAAAASSMLGGPGGPGGMLGMPLAFGKGLLEGAGADFSFGSAAGRAVGQESEAIKIANKAIIPGDARNANRVDHADLLKEARGVANEAGVSTDSALSAMTKFIDKTGDLATLRPMLGQLAGLSQAFGANLDDVANAAAEVSIQLGTMENKGPHIMDLLRNAAAQSKVGTVEFSNLAQSMGKIVASASFFENRDVKAGKLAPELGTKDNIKTFMAFAQIAKRGGAGSVAEQVTGVQALASQFDKDARRAGFKKLKVDIEGEGGKKRDIRDIMVDTIVKAKGDIHLISAAVGDQKAKRLSQGFAAMYNDTVSDFKKTNPNATAAEIEAEARKKLNKALEDLTTATVAQAELERSLNDAEKSKLSQIQIFNNKMDAIVGDLVTNIIPILPTIASGLKDFAGAVGWAITFINKLTGGDVKDRVSGAITLTGDADDRSTSAIRRSQGATAENPLSITPEQLKAEDDQRAQDKAENERGLAKSKAALKAALNGGAGRDLVDFAAYSAEYYVDEVINPSKSMGEAKGRADDAAGRVIGAKPARVREASIEVEMFQKTLERIALASEETAKARKDNRVIVVAGKPPAAAPTGGTSTGMLPDHMP